MNGSEPNNVPALFKVSHEKAMFSVDIDLKRTAWVYIYICERLLGSVNEKSVCLYSVETICYRVCGVEKVGRSWFALLIN